MGEQGDSVSGDEGSKPVNERDGESRNLPSIPVRLEVDVQPVVDAPAEEEENLDTSPFFEYLRSDKGHEVVGRVLAIFEDIKKAAISQQSGHVKRELWMQLGIIGLVVAASTTLAVLGKFDATIGVLFGTLVGYVFGKRSKE